MLTFILSYSEDRWGSEVKLAESRRIASAEFVGELWGGHEAGLFYGNTKFLDHNRKHRSTRRLPESKITTKNEVQKVPPRAVKECISKSDECFVDSNRVMRKPSRSTQ